MSETEEVFAGGKREFFGLGWGEGWAQEAVH